MSRFVGIMRRYMVAGISNASILKSQHIVPPLSSSFFNVNSSNRHQISQKTSTRQYRSSKASLKEDFYKILGVSKRASKDEIKKKFRELAKKYHPDLNKDNKNAEKKFQEVSEAYEILGDDDKRAAYDSYGHAGVDPNFQQGNPFAGAGGFGGFGFGGGGQTINVEDIFEMFSEQMGGGMEGPGKDVETRLKISFMEAVKGCTKDVSYDYFLRQNVGGSGRQRKYQKVRKSKKVSVTIPPGVNNGMQMRLESKGAEGTNGFPPGDLFIHLEVEPDSYFTREGNHVYVNTKVSFTEAILGGVVDVKTLDGTVTMKIPPGTQPGAQLLLRGKGVESYTTRRKGDQIVTINVTIPTKITAVQRRLIEQFEGKHCGDDKDTAKDKDSSSVTSTFKTAPSPDSENESSPAEKKGNIWDTLKGFVSSEEDKRGEKGVSDSMTKDAKKAKEVKEAEI